MPCQRAAAGHRQGGAGRCVAARPQRAGEGDERGQVGVGERVTRHALGRQAVADQRGQVSVVPECQTGHDAGPHLAALPIRPVAARARAQELRLAGGLGLGRLGKQGSGRGQERHPEQGTSRHRTPSHHSTFCRSGCLNT